MTDSKNYMMIFRFEPNPEARPTEEEIQMQRQMWGQFIGNIAIKEKLVGTNQLGFTGKTISADKTVTEGINMDKGIVMGGNMIVAANSMEEAAEMAKDCPILHMGGTVEIRDIMPM